MCGKFMVGWDRSAGIATRYGDRNPMGASFSVPFETGPGAHPASCTVDTGCLSWGVTLTIHPHVAPRLNSRVNPYLLSGPSWPVLGWTLIFSSSFLLIAVISAYCLGQWNKTFRVCGWMREYTTVLGESHAVAFIEWLYRFTLAD